MPSVAALPPDYRIREFESHDRRQSLSQTSSKSDAHKVLAREAENIARSKTSSRLLSNAAYVEAWAEMLSNRITFPKEWYVPDSTRPNDRAFKEAIRLLTDIRFVAAKPEKIHASAEGGIAIVYVGAAKNRAVLEALNDEPPYMLLYDMDGRSLTVEWPVEFSSLSAVIKRLEAHLRGASLATHV